MSELFDERGPATPSRRTAAAALARADHHRRSSWCVGFFALTTFASFYTDRLWYQSAGYGEVFSTLLWTRIGLFLVFGAADGRSSSALNIYLAYRFRPLFRPTSPEQIEPRPLPRGRHPDPHLAAGRRRASSSALFAGTSGVGAVAHLPAVAQRQCRSAPTTPTSTSDIGFYVFDLPWLHYLVDFAMAVAVVALLAAALVHYLYGGIRLQATPRPALRRRAGAALGAARGLRAGQGRRLLAGPLRPGQPDRAR